jgi:hypothetical protein
MDLHIDFMASWITPKDEPNVAWVLCYALRRHLCSTSRNLPLRELGPWFAERRQVHSSIQKASQAIPTTCWFHGISFFYVLRGRKKLWHDYSSSFSPSNRTWTRCKSIGLNYLLGGRNSRCHTSLLCCDIGSAKRSNKFWCETTIVCTRKNILPNHGIMWEAIEQPRRSLPWS